MWLIESESLFAQVSVRLMMSKLLSIINPFMVSILLLIDLTLVVHILGSCETCVLDFVFLCLRCFRRLVSLWFRFSFLSDGNLLLWPLYMFYDLRRYATSGEVV